MTKQSIPKPKRICQVEECGRKHKAKGYCARHYIQILKYGKIFGNARRLKKGEPNRYIFGNDICKIEICNMAGDTKAYAVIDEKDYAKVKDLRWCMTGEGYVSCHGKGRKGIMLSHLIFGLSENKWIDHKDGNPLNNRKSNLRTCTHQQNIHNMKKSKANTSGYKGVSFDRLRNKWIGTIKFDNKTIFLGRFKEKINAAMAYNKAATKYFGEFARLNPI